MGYYFRKYSNSHYHLTHVPYTHGRRLSPRTRKYGDFVISFYAILTDVVLTIGKMQDMHTTTTTPPSETPMRISFANRHFAGCAWKPFILRVFQDGGKMWSVCS